MLAGGPGLLAAYNAFSAAGVAIGAASAAAGAAVAKAWRDRSSASYTRRFAQVQRHAPRTAAPGMNLHAAVQDLIGSLDWLLSVEERIYNSQGGGLLSLFAAPDRKSLQDAGRPIDKDLRRHLRRIWRVCAQSPPSLSSTNSAAGSSCTAGRQQSATSSGRSERKQRSETKLFDPGYGGVSTPGGVCAALCFLAGAFLQLRRAGPGSLQDAERASLRLAVAALARHPVFDSRRRGQPRADGAGGAGAEVDPQFLRWSIALLCLLDAALSWCPADPLGWLGSCEDDAGQLVARVGSPCSFPALAVRLRSCLRRAQDGCPVTWRRLGVHMDNMRSRELPDPWPCAWVQACDASILVRNRTKVALRVELHRPASTMPSPWADWPLLKALFPRAEPVIVADVHPGIEWALRPHAREGRHFQMRLLTEAGVQVCSRSLLRGQTFDFSVRSPSEMRRTSATLRRSPISCVDRSSSRALAVVPSRAKELGAGLGSKDRRAVRSSAPERRISQCSTSVPSAASSRAGAEESDSNAPPGEKPAGNAEVAGAASSDVLEAAICPRCLTFMAARYSRPPAPAYADGVRCDRCSSEMPCPVSRVMGGSKYFHCSHCWFDLCYVCALHEMQEVWWSHD
uniref:Uncharacterized protein n=1 Tax=Alexandrium monilatum TaxID=311494 RepID=A0A7S4T8Y7_9DINO|mmetsp:Transcript_14855/g.47463  ORF Transcript_14855/g.47463 Transcript_14855/m.47463 type:complete len:625 (+) Transcript_14855:60-1934(+)